jgi:hypothetical protein
MQLALKNKPTETPKAGFAELAAALGWAPEEMVAVIRAYFDESGEHGADDALTRLTIGGLIAPAEAWGAFEGEWQSALDRNSLREFHARNVSDFVMEEFAEIITSRIGLCLGFTQTAVGGAGKTYEIGFVDCLLKVAQFSARASSSAGSAGGVSVVFARHPEFQKVIAEGYFNLMNWGDARLDTIALSTPKNVLPLQAADLVAHALRYEDGGPLGGCKIFRWIDGREVQR